MIGQDNYKYLVYAVRSEDRTISVYEFGDYNCVYVEIELGGAFYVGALANQSHDTWYIRRMWNSIQAEPDYDLVGNL